MAKIPTIYAIHNYQETSYHYLPSCPCAACVAERERLTPAFPSPFVRLSVEAAYLFGFIKERPSKSVAETILENKR